MSALAVRFNAAYCVASARFSAPAPGRRPAAAALGARHDGGGGWALAGGEFAAP